MTFNQYPIIYNESLDDHLLAPLKDKPDLLSVPVPWKPATTQNHEFATLVTVVVVVISYNGDMKRRAALSFYCYLDDNDNGRSLWPLVAENGISSHLTLRFGRSPNNVNR